MSLSLTRRCKRIGAVAPTAERQQRLVHKMTREPAAEVGQSLEMIWSPYGPQNRAESITWIKDEEAALWVRDTTGRMVLMAHLTNLANWRLEGTMPTDEELRRDWLQIVGT